MANKAASFSVWGCDSNGWPKCLGKAETYEGAIKLKGSMATVGWKNIAVFDAALEEVKAKPAGKAGISSGLTRKQASDSR